jgi:hypothetical protein
VGEVVQTFEGVLGSGDDVREVGTGGSDRLLEQGEQELVLAREVLGSATTARSDRPPPGR